LAIFPLEQAGRSNQTELRPHDFFLGLPSFEQNIFQAILNWAIFPHDMRDVLTKLNYAPVCF
jgi:hypothetical protein